MKFRMLLDMYSRIKRHRKKQILMKMSLVSFVLGSLAFLAMGILNAGSFLGFAETRQAESQVKIEPISVAFALEATASDDKELKEETIEPAQTAETTHSEHVVHATQATQTHVAVEQPQVAHTNHTPSYTAYPTVLANGNSAGAIGSEAAAQMAAKTGVPQATWEYIIARESNGDPTAVNASGASGLFQTMPGWGSTATVEDQINAAVNAYNNQGLAAWGM